MSASETQGKVRIAVDLGASSGRVIAGINDAGKLKLREIHRFENPAIELPSGLYWNILGLFHEILTGLRKSVSDYGENIASVAIDTWACDFGLFDEAGELITPPHQYRDPRFEGMAEIMHDLVPEEKIFARTGIKTNFYNSSLHLLSLKRNHTEAMAAAAEILFIPDIFAYWLTGIKAVERTNASTSQLLDPVTGDWARDIISELGLPERIFGRIVAPGTVLGEILPTLLPEYSANIPFVTAPCHDTASAVAGIPLSEAEPLWLSSGTWSIMGVETTSAITTPEALAFGFCNELGVNGTVRFLKNIAGLWIIQECKRQWEREGNSQSFGELAELAAAERPFSAFIDPDHPSFSSPGDMPEKIRKFCAESGQSIPSSVGSILRVATDSLAMKYRLVFERIVSLTGRPYSRLHIGGGGIQNEALCQATADALGIEVQAGPVEATSCGNIITQMIATGEISDFREGRQLIRDSFDFRTFTPQNPEAWDEAYQSFHTILPDT